MDKRMWRYGGAPLTLGMALLAAVLCGAAPAADLAPDHAVGVVFHDRDADGVRDQGEEGLAGVAVTNGREVTTSGVDGQWRLPVSSETVLSVIKPRGWMPPLDADNHPTGYYVHRPAGSPTVAFAGVAPTGPLPASVSFPLVPHEEPDRFQVALLGDPQVAEPRQVDFFAHDIVEGLVGQSFAFGLTLGDNVDEVLSLLEPVKATLGTTGFPWYYTLGNNDMNYDSDDVHAAETFLRVLGPTDYAFNWGPVHFLVLDDLVWDPAAGRYTQGLMPSQIEFVRNDLALVPRETLVVLAMHAQVNWLADYPALLREFAGRPHVLALAGHAHSQSNVFIDQGAGWPNPEPLHQFVCVASCGPVWLGNPDEYGIPNATTFDGTPNGYAVATFDGASYEIEYFAARRPRDWQMTIDAPEAVRIEDTTATVVSANVFAGSGRSTVEMRLMPDGDWAPMARVEKPDPTYVRTASEQPKPPEGYGILGDPGVCQHLWEAPLPAGLHAGSYRIEVRTTDMFGHTYVGSRTIRVE